MSLDYETLWKKPLTEDHFEKCPSCESRNLSREFCGEYICENCGNNFGVCNLWNTKTYEPIRLQKSKSMKQYSSTHSSAKKRRKE